MTYLLIFISGILFINFLYPILDSISVYICNYFSSKSIKLQVQTEKVKAEIDETPIRTIGFQIPNEEDWEEENDE